MRHVLLVLLSLTLLTGSARAAESFAQGADQVLQHRWESGKLDSTKELKDILARPEFGEAQKPPPGPSLMERIMDWLLRHMPGMRALEGAGTTVVVVAVVIGSILLALFFYWLMRWLWLRLSQGRVEAADAIELNLDATSLRELARKSASNGDYQTALRYRFKSVVGELGAFDSEHLTNWQLLRHVRREHGAATRDFAALVAIFEDCWYGGQPADAKDYSRAEELARSIEELIRPREAAA